MTTGAYMLVALVTASGSCQEPQVTVRKMVSLELCRAAADLVTNAGGLANCVPTPSPNGRASHAVGHRWQEEPSRRSAAAEEEVRRLNRAQLGDQ
jgi:hypothetical protein